MNQPRPNTDPENGIAYGIAYANNFPWIFDDITSQGESLSYKAIRKELEQKVTSALKDAIDDYCHNPAKIVEHINCEQLVGNLLDAGLTDHIELEEEEWEWEDDGTTYLIKWLGGAPHLWVTKSKYVTRCGRCSPCIPFGGDLDTLGGLNGTTAYCPPPNEWNVREDAKYNIVETPREDGLIELTISEVL